VFIAYVLDDEVYGGQVFIVLRDDDQRPSSGGACLLPLLDLTAKVPDGEVVPEPMTTIKTVRMKGLAT
jgi:hypothetical protein